MVLSMIPDWYESESDKPTLYLLYRKKDGTWTEGIEFDDYVEGGVCPTVVHDGRHLFFIGTADGRPPPYWFDAGFIEELRPKE